MGNEEAYATTKGNGEMAKAQNKIHMLKELLLTMDPHKATVIRCINQNKSRGSVTSAEGI